MEPRCYQIGRGARLYCITTDRFKSEYLSAQFYLPLTAEAAQENTLLTAVLKRGTASYPDKKSINRRLDQLYSTTVGSRSRRFGDMQNIGFSADFLGARFVGEEDLLLEVSDLLSELLQRPFLQNGSLCESYTESEKTNLRDAIRAAINDPRGYAAAECRKLLCAGEPYALSLLGEEATVAALSADALTRRHKELLQGSAPVFFYVGACAPERVREILEQRFSSLSDKAPVPECTVRGVSSEPIRAEREMPLCQGKLSIGFRTEISMRHPLAPALQMLNEIFGGSAASKLFLNVREKRSLCYHCSSSLDLFKGVILANAGMRPENRAVTEEAMLEEFWAIARGEITDIELEAARRSLDHSYTQLFDNPGALCDFYAGRRMIGSEESVASWRERLQRVTKQDVVAAAALLRPGAVFFLKGTLDEEDEE